MSERSPFDHKIRRKGLKARCFGSEIRGEPYDRRGFPTALTLLELLVVLTLMAALMGIGVGIFGRLNLGKQAAPGLVKNVLRSTRSLAVLEGTPARVAVDRKAGAIWGQGLRTIGLWHFEDERLEGAFRRDGILHGGEVVPEGRLGSCVRFAGTAEQWIELPVGGLSAYATGEGIGADFDIRLDRLTAATFLERRGSFALAATSEGALKAEVSLVGGPAEGGGKNFAETRPGSLQFDRWQRISFLYDRRRIRILVDGVEEASVEEGAPLRAPEEPILVGNPFSHFEGRIDELRIAAVVPGDTVTLSRGVAIAPGPDAVHFDGAGDLDPLFHSGPATLTLQFEEGKKVPIEVGIYGTIR